MKFLALIKYCLKKFLILIFGESRSQKIIASFRSRYIYFFIIKLPSYLSCHPPIAKSFKSEINLVKLQNFYDSEILTISNRAVELRPAKFKIDEPSKLLFPNPLFQYSKVDTFGDILTSNNEAFRNKIFRGVAREKVQFFLSLYNRGILQALADSGKIVKFKLSDYYTDKFPLILEIDKLRVISSNCWTFSMIKEAAISLLLIDATLKKYGYAIADGHIYNQAFNHGVPVFFDIGSFIYSSNQTSHFFAYFKEFFLKTLQFSLLNKEYLQLQYSGIAPKYSNLVSTLNLNLFFEYHRRNSSKSYYKALKTLFDSPEVKPEYIEAVFSEYPHKSSHEAENCESRYFTGKAENARLRKIVDLVQIFSSDAKTSVDLAGASGYFSSLLEKTGKFEHLASLEPNEAAIETGRFLKNNSLIDFYWADPMHPSWLKFLYDAHVENLSDILKSDICFALGVTHHWLLLNNIKLDYIFSTIAKYTKKYVYIEFWPLGLKKTDQAELPPWYSERWFEKHFHKFFNLLHKEVVDRIKVGGVEKTHSILFIGRVRDECIPT